MGDLDSEVDQKSQKTGHQVFEEETFENTGLVHSVEIGVSLKARKDWMSLSLQAKT